VAKAAENVAMTGQRMAARAAAHAARQGGN